MVKRLAMVFALCAACAPQHKQLVIPDEMLTEKKVRPPPQDPQAQPVTTVDASGRPVGKLQAAVQQPHPASVPRPPPQNVVLRLAEHGRNWEVELPDSTGGYEVRLPLGDAVPNEKPTAADQELAVAGDKPKRSYLSGLARVTEMFSSKRYELALIEVVNLEAEFPQESRIFAMKGTLLSRLGKPALAREAWQKALALDPQDAAVQEALRELSTNEEGQQ